MGDDRIAERWQHLALHIGDEVREAVNLPTDIGTDYETGYFLMFFNAKNHSDGKSTVVSSCTDRAGLKKLLKAALRNIDRATVVEPGLRQ